MFAISEETSKQCKSLVDAYATLHQRDDALRPWKDEPYSRLHKRIFIHDKLETNTRTFKETLCISEMCVLLEGQERTDLIHVG